MVIGKYQRLCSKGKGNFDFHTSDNLKYIKNILVFFYFQNIATPT